MGTRLETNRAPLVLAFAVTVLKYTMPAQPLSSRLSLAQAVVSANSRSKARNIGLESGKGAEEEGWGRGQPGVRVLGRGVKVLRRWGYSGDEGDGGEKKEGEVGGDEEWDTQGTLKAEGGGEVQSTGMENGRGGEKIGSEQEGTEALWGLDLEALKKSNGPAPLPGTQRSDGAGLPIYRPEHARAYLLKSFATAPHASTSTSTTEGGEKGGGKGKKMTVSMLVKEKEENLARLLKALDLLFESWRGVLATEELDRRAWAWYVAVRPEVRDGVAGWGGKGEVRLEKVLGLRRGV